jgi:hypothetical protein
MLKKLIKAILIFFRLLSATLVSLLKIVHYSKLFPKIKTLRTVQKSDCYVLGTGPSLKDNLKYNIELLKTKDLFVVNDFVKSDYFEVLKPKYYVLIDPCYWSSYVHRDFLEDGIIVLNTINKKVNWPIFLIVPDEAYKTSLFKNIFDNNKNVNLVNFNSTSVSGFKWFSFLTFKNFLGMPPVNNVLGACIFSAINIQYSEINILGADHSWTQDLIVNEKNQVCYSNPHFYDEVNLAYLPLKTVYGQYYTMHGILRDYALMFEGHHILRCYADFRKVKIFNLSKNSFIDAFERRDLY